MRFIVLVRSRRLALKASNQFLPTRAEGRRAIREDLSRVFKSECCVSDPKFISGFSRIFTQGGADKLRQDLLGELREEIDGFGDQPAAAPVEEPKECPFCLMPLGDDDEEFVALNCPHITEEKKFDRSAHHMHKTCYEEGVQHARGKTSGFLCPMCRAKPDARQPYFSCGTDPLPGSAPQVDPELQLLRDAEAKVEDFVGELARADAQHLANACLMGAEDDGRAHRMIFRSAGDEEEEVIKELWDRSNEIGEEFILGTLGFG